MAEFISTRPQRSSDEIAADRKAADVFFHRFDLAKSRRDTNSLLAYYAHHWRLLRCDAEARQWSKRVTPTSAERSEAVAQRKAAADAAEEATRIPPRGNTPLRQYAHPVTRRMLPETALHIASPTARLGDRTEAVTFWKRCASSETFRARLLQGQIPFTQWAITHPDYGPIRDAPEHYTGSIRPAPKDRFKKGDIRPAGMSYDRALQIAMRALR